MKRFFGLLLASIFVFSGCLTQQRTTELPPLANNQPEQSTWIDQDPYFKDDGDLTAEKIKKVENFSVEDLIFYYRSTRWPEKARERILNILVKKGLPEKELPYIKKNQYFIGMTEVGLYLSIGEPEKTNRTVTQGGESKQCVYTYWTTGLDQRQKEYYIYVENGVVTAYQD